jgi:serine/threonine protein phosphatase PrpC
LRDNYIIDLGDAAARSDRGRKDDENQDYFLVAKRDVQGKIVKWIVGADGLSQAPEAARAAELACKTISRAIEQEIITGLFDPKKVLARVFAAGNQALLEMSFDRDADHNRGKKLARPMCTVIIILAVDGKPYLCWAGDSPGYGVYSESGQAWAVRFTTDDTVLESLLKQGKSYAEAVKDPRAKEMTQCLGVSNVVPNIAELAPKRLQNLVAIVATTDGPSACFEGQDPLTGKDRPLKLLAQLYLRSFGSAARLVDGLVRIAKDGPAGDNNSAAAIYLQP